MSRRGDRAQARARAQNAVASRAATQNIVIVSGILSRLHAALGPDRPEEVALFRRVAPRVARGPFNLTPRPPPSLTAPSLISSMPAAPNASISFIKESTLPRMVS